MHMFLGVCFDGDSLLGVIFVIHVYLPADVRDWCKHCGRWWKCGPCLQLCQSEALDQSWYCKTYGGVELSLCVSTAIDKLFLRYVWFISHNALHAVVVYCCGCPGCPSSLSVINWLLKLCLYKNVFSSVNYRSLYSLCVFDVSKQSEKLETSLVDVQDNEYCHIQRTLCISLQSSSLCFFFSHCDLLKEKKTDRAEPTNSSRTDILDENK